jgi:hypothetical protein
MKGLFVLALTNFCYSPKGYYLLATESMRMDIANDHGKNSFKFILYSVFNICFTVKQTNHPHHFSW